MQAKISWKHQGAYAVIPALVCPHVEEHPGEVWKWIQVRKLPRETTASSSVRGTGITQKVHRMSSTTYTRRHPLHFPRQGGILYPVLLPLAEQSIEEEVLVPRALRRRRADRNLAGQLSGVRLVPLDLDAADPCHADLVSGSGEGPGPEAK